MKVICITLFLLGTVMTVHAQNLKGKVFGSNGTDKEILPGASVHWLHTSTGTTANENGVFSIDIPADGEKKLVVSFTGYDADTITITAQTYLSVTLKENSLLKEVTIKEQKLHTNVYQTEVITQKELSKAACCDMAGCFETQATVQPQTTNVITNSKELRILGLSGVYNQLLFDGLPFFQGPAYTYGISSYPGTLIDNIYVSKGANSVLQGYEGISGQINVVPKVPGKTDKIFANAYMNNFLEKHFNLNLAPSLGEGSKWSTLLALHTVQPAEKFDRDGDNFLDLPLLTRYMIYNSWKYGDDAKKGFYTRIGFRYLDEQRIGGQKFFDPGKDKGSANVYGQSVRFSQPEVSLKAGYRLNDAHAVVFMTSAWYHKQQSYFGTLRYDAEQLNANFLLQHEWSWNEKHQLKYGASLRYQQLQEDISFTAVTDVRSYAGRYKTPQQIAGVFAENAFNWKRFTWLTGMRFDHHQVFGSYFTPRTLLKYDLNASNTVRASAGTGWRQVNMFSENINLLASSRDVVFVESLKPEKGFNWGLNYTFRHEGKQTVTTISADFYQTRFFNQFFPDYDSDPTKAYIRNFEGTSVSNSFQLEAGIKAFKTWEFKAAYNYLDVFRVENGTRVLLPFNPANRMMTAISFRPGNWYFDINAHWYDKQRLPNTASSPEQYRNTAFSKPYGLLNAQITYKWKSFDFYGGCENVFDFRQKRPIISWQDPFSTYFDTSFIWGPTRGRELYVGVKWRMI